MEDMAEIERKERERAVLFDEATRIVRKAEMRSMGLSVEEDACLHLPGKSRRV